MNLIGANVSDRGGVIPLLFLLIAVQVLSLGCRQAKRIPEEIPGQLPNPVRDFTEKDNYIIGLNWYRQQNYQIAVKYWKPLALEGDCDARYALGLLYFDGLGVGQSYEKAIRLWSESARQGQAQSQISLGVVYSRTSLPYTALDCRRGCGSEKDLLKAYSWLGIACKIGSPREKKVAEESLNRVAREMTPEQIKEGDSLIESWKPAPALCETRGLYILDY